MKSHFAMFAAYNRWCNERLYEAAGRLADADYRMPRGAFFGSLHGTLNHLLVADRIWLLRFAGEGPSIYRLDEILFEDLESLGIARREDDERIIATVEGLSEADLGGTITYRNSAGAEFTQPLATALAHFFNHQTHHRGQAHALLTIARGRDFAPSLDLILFQRATGIGLG